MIVQPAARSVFRYDFLPRQLVILTGVGLHVDSSL